MLPSLSDVSIAGSAAADAHSGDANPMATDRADHGAAAADSSSDAQSKTGLGDLGRGTQPTVRAFTPEEFGIGQLYWAIRDAVVVGDAETGRIVLWNPAAEELFGITAAEAVGQPIEMLVPQPLRERHRAGLARFQKTGRGILIDTGQPVELPALRRTGEPITIELTLSPIAVSPVPGRFVLALIRDATLRKKAEGDRLRQSEERFRTAFEHAIIGMALVGLDGHFLQVNAALCTLIGYSAPELLTKTFREITHPDDLEADRGKVDRLQAGKISAFRLEKRYLHKNGRVIWARLSASLVSDERGSPAHVIAMIEDITARKQAEEDLRASAARYRALVEQLPAVVYMLAADEIQSPLYFSPSIKALTGETPEEALAFREHWLTLVHPEDRERVAAEDERTAAAGEIFRVEYRHRRKDGSYIWIRDECAPLRDEMGQITAWQGVMLDISERMRAEVAEAETRIREEQRDQLRIILDHLPAGVLIITEPDGLVEQANTTASQMIFGAICVPGMLPVYGRDFRFLRLDGTAISNELRPGVRALRGEVVDHEQLLLERQDGSRVPVLTHAALLPNATGEIARAVLVLQDVSRFWEAEQLKDDFLSLVSHEFRTPLTAVHGGSHLLLNQGHELDEQTRHELLSDIVTESDRLDHMLANMLTLAAVMAGRLTVSTEPVLLGPLARKIAADVARYVPHHTLRIVVSPQTPPVEADPALLGEVLANLYENAAKYSPIGSEVVTTAFRDGESVTIEIADTGIGIAPDQLERIFARFHRVNADSSVRGTGLGLYLSRSLVEAQGGVLVANSAGPGKGSIFTITLPIAHGWAPTD